MYFGISCFCVINSCKDRILQDFVKGGGVGVVWSLKRTPHVGVGVSSYNPPTIIINIPELVNF